MDPKTSWDSLRKQARKLEAHLDDQMHLYRNIVSTKVDDDHEKDLGSRIEELLKELQQVISLMDSWLSSGGSEIFSHTLTRHREIHHDLTQEFNRLRSSLKAKRDHASLLEDFREFERSRSQLEDDGGSQEQSSLLKERGALLRNTGQIDGVISQAQETLGSLVFQRSKFGGIDSKISNIKSRLPTVSEQHSFGNKEKEIKGCYHSFNGCFILYFSDYDLLVSKIVKYQCSLTYIFLYLLTCTYITMSTLFLCNNNDYFLSSVGVGERKKGQKENLPREQTVAVTKTNKYCVYKMNSTFALEAKVLIDIEAKVLITNQN